MATDKTSPILGAQVLYLQAHVGIMVNHQSVTGLHHEKHNVRMNVTPVGIHCLFSKTAKTPEQRYLIPFTNIESLQLASEAE